MQSSFPSRAYFLCADARTGSSLLAGALRLTGLAGKPCEYFSEAEIDKPWLRKDELHVPDDEPFTGFRDWRDYILRAGSELNGVFGATVHWFQLKNALATFASEPSAPAVIGPRSLDILRGFFPELRLIWLRRKNVVAQAISHYVAINTGVWNYSSLSTIPMVTVDVNVPYDFSSIDWQVKSANVAADGWRSILKGSEHLTLALTYEELADDLAGAVRKVLTHLDISLGEAEPPLAPLQKQASVWSHELERRYRGERRARGLGPVGDEDFR
jgi:LPS sulfotransferase NodH